MRSSVKKLVRKVNDVNKIEEDPLFIDQEFIIRISDIPELSRVKFKEPKKLSRVSMSKQFLLFLKFFLKIIDKRRDFILKFLGKDNVKITPLSHEKQIRVGINGDSNSKFPAEFIFEANKRGIEISLVGGWSYQIDERTLRILGEIKDGLETHFFSKYLGE